MHESVDEAMLELYKTIFEEKALMLTCVCVLHHIAPVLLYTSPIATLHRSIAAYMYTYTQVKLHSQIKEMKGPKRQRTIDLSSTQAQNIIAYKCVIHPHMYM